MNKEDELDKTEASLYGSFNTEAKSRQGNSIVMSKIQERRIFFGRIASEMPETPKNKRITEKSNKRIRIIVELFKRTERVSQ